MTRWLVRAAVSAIVVAVLLAFIPFRSVIDALRRVDPWVWGASLVIFFAGHYLNAVKLRLLIGARLLPLSACVRAQYAGLVANVGLPGIAGGDLVRAAYLAPTAGTARVALASVADRIIDTLTLVALILCAVPFVGVPSILADVVSQATVWAIWLSAVGLVLAVAIIALGRRWGLADTARRAWSELRTRQSALILATLISLGVQSTFVMTNVWLAQSVGVTTGLAAWFMAWPLSKLVAILPISLGGIGVREAVLVTLLTPLGAPKDAVLASGLLWQAVLTVSGLAGLFVTHVLLKRVTADQEVHHPNASR